ncbi:DUF1877 family protein [Williamsia sp. 1135]|uniref:DUF1877 family protein n=1 Tax=Williamsia sp. 1135 TaxID=1889262 RepID=UPI000A0F7270|nr:DUF1877 family protein [Williamsia sp. 1135]ORM26912.1 hypothetical protein BFL43_22930 [Williamsia sp. 1135]
MGMILTLTQLTDAGLHEIHALGEAGDISEFVWGLSEADPSVTVDLDKSYDALEVMFDHARIMVNPISGQGTIPGDYDFGEGIPNYMSPEYVVAARDCLVHMTFDTLLEATGTKELSKLRVPPFLHSWDAGGIEYLRSNYDILSGFVTNAAERSCHIVMQLG